MPEFNQMPRPQTKKSLTIIIVLVIIIGIAIIGFVALSNKNNLEPSSNNVNQPSSTNQPDDNANPQAINKPVLGQTNQNANANQNTNNNQNANSNSQENETPEKTFTVIGRSYSFTPAEIRVAKGDKVKIIFQNVEGFHDWTIDEFNAKTPQISAGQTATVEFIADRIGQFEYYCSVGTHRQMGMKGNLIVE